MYTLSFRVYVRLRARACIRHIHTIDEAATVGLEGLMLVGDLEFFCGTDTERGLSECSLASPLFPECRVRDNPK